MLFNYEEYSLRLVNSVLFRIIVIAYALALVATYKNVFSPATYAIAFPLYILLYFILLRKNRAISIIRLLNDYCFIILILYGKPTGDIPTSIFLLLPLINTLNHSGDKGLDPFPISIYICVFASYYFLKNQFSPVGIIFPIVAITAINGIFFLKLYLINFNNSLYSTIEDYYQDNLNIGKTHKILKQIIQNHQETFMGSLIPLDFLMIFKFNSQRGLQAVIGSKFVVRYQVAEWEKFVTLIETGNEVKNHQIHLDNKISVFNLFIPYDFNKQKYVFFLGFTKGPISIILNIYIKRVLYPLLAKIAKVLDVEYKLQQENKNYYRQLKDRMDEIDIAVNAIHYLNNRLSPIVNYFEMLKVHDTLTEPELKDQLSELIKKERNNAINNITPITDKMNQMAEKTKNLTIVTETSTIKLRNIFSITRKAFDETVEIKSDLIIDWTAETFEQQIVTNTNLFTFVIDEVIINLGKHSKGESTVKFAYDGSLNPTITFTNVVKNHKGKELAKAINDFNQDSISEIMKRDSKGLKLIKQYLEQLSIGHKMILNDDKLSLILTFNNESSNIRK